MTPLVPVRTRFPRQVMEIENCWIPMPDGVRLAARIWMPEDAETDPVPAILEYLPYRKRDGTVERDQLTHPYFAGHGYAGVRVDMRGTGDSEGICQGEYLLQEQEDCLAVIAWLAAQPWCSGKVGMIGISWGGFNGLQVAARRPEALGGVISLCSTDDRFADDIHFMGGAVLTSKLSWGATAFAIAHTPPDPVIVGKRWCDMWRERLEGNGLWLLDWFRHQRRDAFYAHGSICENYADIEVPVYLVGGWADGYTNAIFRMLEHLACPRKGLVGPWAHKYPHFARPGPRIGFLQECLRWWDQHLKGIETGIMDEPILRAWIQDPVAPRSHYRSRPGHWVTLPSWSGTAMESMTRFAATGKLQDAPGSAITLTSPQNAGHTAGDWCGYGVVPDGPVDQSGETGMTWFDSELLVSDLHLLGFPVLTATVRSDVPQANLAATLSAVDEAGRATLISYGLLNLTHRDSHASPEPIPAGPVSVRLQLNACGQRIARGQRLRLALSNAYWPTIWPSPQPSRLILSDTKLELPISTGKPAPDRFLPPEAAQPVVRQDSSEGSYERGRSVDNVSGVGSFETHADSGVMRFPHIGMAVRNVEHDCFTIHPDDPNTAKGSCTRIKQYGRNDWQAELKVRITVRASPVDWKISADLKASHGDVSVVEKSWSVAIPRDQV